MKQKYKKSIGNNIKIKNEIQNIVNSIDDEKKLNIIYCFAKSLGKYGRFGKGGEKVQLERQLIKEIEKLKKEKKVTCMDSRKQILNNSNTIFDIVCNIIDSIEEKRGC